MLSPESKHSAPEPGHEPDSWVIELGPVEGGVSVGASDRELLARLAHYFGTDPPRAASGQEVALRVQGPDPDGKGLYELFGHPKDPRQSTNDFALLVERLDGAVDEVVAASHERDYLVLHASAVEEPEGLAVLFVGRSMSGKSTTATLFALEGAALFGDECLALRLEPGAAQVLRWRRPLSLRKDVLDIVAERAGWSAANRESVLVTPRKRLVPATEVLACSPRIDQRPLGHLIWMDPEAPTDGPVESGGLFRELLAACHFFQRDGEELFGSLASLARSLPCSRVRPGPGIIERVRSQLAGGA